MGIHFRSLTPKGKMQDYATQEYKVSQGCQHRHIKLGSYLRPKKASTVRKIM